MATVVTNKDQENLNSEALATNLTQEGALTSPANLTSGANWSQSDALLDSPKDSTFTVAFKVPTLSPFAWSQLEIFKANIRKFRVWHDIDVATAEYIVKRLSARLDQRQSSSAKALLVVYYLVLLLSYCRSEQHSCVPCHEIAGKLAEVLQLCSERTAPSGASGDEYLYTCVLGFLQAQALAPKCGFKELVEVWQSPAFISFLQAHELLEVYSAQNITLPQAPLVFDEDNFYIARSFWYEHKVALGLKLGLGLTEVTNNLTSTNTSLALPQELELTSLLQLFFPSSNDTDLAFGVNWQKIAVAEAVRHPLAVITGGPGTGKTTSVAKLVSILTAMALTQGKILRLGMAAPTGKAADRMVQSFTRNFADLRPEALPSQCTQIFAQAASYGQKTQGHLTAGVSQEVFLGLEGALSPQEVASHVLSSFKELKAVTIQAMLGLNPETTLCKYNSKTKLPYDVIIIDEASMIDLENFSRLLDATAPGTRLIFLGDRDQLASVDAGSVLGDICSIFRRERTSLSDKLQQLLLEEERYILEVTGYDREALRQSALSYSGQDPNLDLNPVLVAPGLGTLLHSYRFKADSAIGRLARDINNSQRQFKMEQEVEQETVRKFSCFSELEDFIASWQEQDASTPPALWLPSLERKEATKIADFLYQRCLKAWLELVWEAQGQPDGGAIFKSFNSFRVLTPVNDGVFGVKNLNTEILNRALQEVKRMSAKHAETKNTEAKNKLSSSVLATSLDEKWFPGLPHMITKNNKELGVFNGDIGICVFDEEWHKVIRFENGRTLYPSMLPDVVPAFVLSIHKSQGSEFNHTMVLIPSYGGRLLCRELVYTAVTRAKGLVSILGEAMAIDMASGRNCVRYSGLAQRLYG